MPRPFRTLPAAFLSACLLLLPALPATSQDAPRDAVQPTTTQTAAAPGLVPVEEGVATVEEDDLLPLPHDRALIRVDVPREGEAPVLAPSRTGLAAERLRRLYADGEAAGNWGDLYENRDRGHSALPADAFPQLTRIAYGDSLSRGRGYGVALDLVYDAPLIGNSSTALTGGTLWRSQPRFALTRPGGPARLYANYRSGQVHVYPEHRDHDPENGDLLTANTPYYLISQGSSGSDRPHLEALAMILAAFRPETKARLKAEGLLGSTLQMVYRRGRDGAAARYAYLSGAAHPAVFDAKGINLASMVTLANAIAPDEIPPVVQLQVLEETQAREGVDYFGEGLDERIFDTPSAIARVWRSGAWRREMTLSAAETVDPNGRELSFDWVLLRGDPARVRIEKLTPDGRYAHVSMEWQAPRPVPGRPDMISPRVEIGVFADNGAQLSAPAFVSVLLPRHERRVYETAPGGGKRIASLDRRAAEGVYADPLVFPRMPWRDVYRYDAEGKLAGWLRHGPEGETRFDPQGRRLRDGGPPEKLHYRPVQEESGATTLEVEVVADE
ncbi:hypothetical protein E0K89_018985 [Aquicoccus sp. SCR17]|nr:hypothetical protein [Carideicomes alvinocaridis]